MTVSSFCMQSTRALERELIPSHCGTSQLLNTVSNLGGTWPKFFVLKGIDAFSVAVCRVQDENLDLVVASASPFLKLWPLCVRGAATDVHPPTRQVGNASRTTAKRHAPNSAVRA